MGLSFPRPGEAVWFNLIAGTTYTGALVAPPKPPVGADGEHTPRGRSDG